MVNGSSSRKTIHPVWWIIRIPVENEVSPMLNWIYWPSIAPNRTLSSVPTKKKLLGCCLVCLRDHPCKIPWIQLDWTMTFSRRHHWSFMIEGLYVLLHRTLMKRTTLSTDDYSIVSDKCLARNEMRSMRFSISRGLLNSFHIRSASLLCSLSSNRNQ